MRDSFVQLKSVVNSVDTPMMASFVVLPGPSVEDRGPIQDFASVQYDSAKFVSDVNLVGDPSIFCFE